MNNVSCLILFFMIITSPFQLSFGMDAPNQPNKSSLDDKAREEPNNEIETYDNPYPVPPTADPAFFRGQTVWQEIPLDIEAVTTLLSQQQEGYWKHLYVLLQKKYLSSTVTVPVSYEIIEAFADTIETIYFVSFFNSLDIDVMRWLAKIVSIGFERSLLEAHSIETILPLIELLEHLHRRLNETEGAHSNFGTEISRIYQIIIRNVEQAHQSLPPEPPAHSQRYLSDLPELNRYVFFQTIKAMITETQSNSSQSTSTESLSTQKRIRKTREKRRQRIKRIQSICGCGVSSSVIEDWRRHHTLTPRLPNTRHHSTSETHASSRRNTYDQIDAPPAQQSTHNQSENQAELRLPRTNNLEIRISTSMLHITQTHQSED